MDIASDQHFCKKEFLGRFKTTLRIPLPGISEGSEQHVPQRQIGVVEGVDTFFMVDAVALWPLEKEAQPVRGANVPVVNEFCEAAEENGSSRGSRPQANDQVENRARECAIRENFKGVFVKTGDHFNALEAVMDLVEPASEEIALVAPAMPPVEEKSDGEIAED